MSDLVVEKYTPKVPLRDTDYHVWIEVEQRLDGLTSRWGPDPNLELIFKRGDEPAVKVKLSLSLAKTLARGINKAVKRAEA